MTLPTFWVREFHGGRVFAFDALLSHPSGDSSRELAEALQRKGCRVWYDETQIMEDALWRPRLTLALRNARYVVLHLDRESDLGAHPWVLAECRSALEAERRSQVERLLIATQDKNPDLPNEFKSARRLLVPDHVELMVHLLKSNNSVPDDWFASEPPPTVRDTISRWPTDLGARLSSSNSKIIAGCVRTALRQVNGSPRGTSHALYELFMSRKAPWRLRRTDRATLGDLVPALEALAVVNNPDTRAQAQGILQLLAERSVVGSLPALVRTLRRESNSHLLDQMCWWFLENPNRQTQIRPVDWNRVLLCLGPKEIAARVAQKTTPEADAIRLRNAVETTAYRFLVPPPAEFETKRRFSLLVSNRKNSSYDWEIFLRDLATRANLGQPWLDLNKLIPRNELLLLLRYINQVSKTFAHHPEPTLWRIPFDTCVLQPLALASAVKGFRRSTRKAYNGFLDSLAAPVISDLVKAKQAAKRHCNKSEITTHVLDVLIKGLDGLLSGLRNYRAGPSLRQDPPGVVWWDTKLGAFELYDILQQARTAESVATHTAIPSASVRRIWNRWAGSLLDLPPFS